MATDGTDHDVVVVGGGPAGCAAAIFTARYGLDTVVFDRGPAALPRCAYLENYPGFPAGVGVETFRGLLHDHVAEAGGGVVEETVTAVERPGDAFAVTTEDDRRTTADRVVAAAWYDGSYLRPLGGDEMVERNEHHGETEERFARDYADRDGRTPVDGLYVASPVADRNAQAVVSAGQGAHVARSLLEDVRREQGYPEAVASHHDWLRPASQFSGEWGDRERWREWFDGQVGDDHDVSEKRLAELREADIDRAFGARRSPEAVEEAKERGYRRLLDHVDNEYIRAYLAETDDADAPQ